MAFDKATVDEYSARPPRLMTARTPYVETFLISLAVILLEVSYTRVFSFKLVYYFTYLIIGISLLGLGAGGVFVAISARLRRSRALPLIPACCLAGSGAVFVGYVAVARIQLNAFELISSLGARALLPSLREGAKLVLICISLFIPFFTAGLALATIFATRTERISRLYFADLLGAGLGCALSIPLIATISPPGGVMVAGLAFTLAGARLAVAHSRRLMGPLGAVGLILLLGAAFPSRLGDPIPDRVKNMSPQRHDPLDVLFSRWSPVFRVDVLRLANDPMTLMISHDGMWGSVIKRFDGEPSSLKRYDANARAHPFRLLPAAPTVAIIGAAGGNEILAALHFGAAHVTGVELNPVTHSLLTTHFADFSGRLPDNPRVTWINAEGRSFLKSRPARYDLIWFVAPDSYAAMNAATSGAFVLSESYLYTTEMIVDSLEHLTEGGLICTQFGEEDFERKPNRTVRYLATAREAFHRLGIEDFARHVLVGTSPGFLNATASTILLKKAPVTEGDVAHFIDSTSKIRGATVRHAWTERNAEHPVHQVIALGKEALERWYGEYPFNMRPVTDDSPFFWHFVRFRDVLADSVHAGDPGEQGKGERLLLLLLGVATVFAAVFLLAPLLAIREVWSAIPHKAAAGLYFAALGAGFMFLEISLIQRLTLFLGYPTYSLTVTLFALLVSTGLGSLLSERYGARRNAALVGLGVGLVVLVMCYAYGLTPLVSRGVGWPLGVRVMVAVTLLVPLGLCLGGFMPLGLRTVAAVSSYGEEFVAWGWAVNGFFSVVSSVLATILSMTIGFHLVMLSAVVVYFLGIAALLRIPAPGPVTAPSMPSPEPVPPPTGTASFKSASMPPTGL